MVPTDEKQPPPSRDMVYILKTFIRKAHPALFTVIMATGIISTLFSEFPYGKDSKGMIIACLIFFFLNLVLLCIFSSGFLAKHSIYQDRWAALVRNPAASLYLGAFPMGVCTLLNVSVNVLYDHIGYGGRNFLYFLWSMWWLVVIIGCLCCWAGVHAMATIQKHTMGTMAPSWLLPVTTLTVVASCGGILANALQSHSTQHALITTVTSIFLVSIGLCLGLMVLTLYLARLIIYGLPTGGSILSVFLPLGTMGQSGYAFYLAGRNLQAILPYDHPGSSKFLASVGTGEVLYIVCVGAAFILWTLATMWMLFALLAIQTSLKVSRPPFAVSFWGLVFPNGVYANLTLTLGKAFDSRGFRIYGSAYAVVVLCLWTCIAVRSLCQLNVVVAPPVSPNNRSDGSTLRESDEYEGELDYPPWNYDFPDPPTRRRNSTASSDMEVGVYTS